MKRNWAQILSNIALILGLVVLIYEVRQSNLYAESENVSASFAISIAREESVFGENPAGVLAKALEDPEGLSTSEILVVDAYHRQFFLIAPANQLLDI